MHFLGPVSHTSHAQEPHVATILETHGHRMFPHCQKLCLTALDLVSQNPNWLALVLKAYNFTSAGLSRVISRQRSYAHSSSSHMLVSITPVLASLCSPLGLCAVHANMRVVGADACLHVYFLISPLIQNVEY